MTRSYLDNAHEQFAYSLEHSRGFSTPSTVNDLLVLCRRVCLPLIEHIASFDYNLALHVQQSSPLCIVSSLILSSPLLAHRTLYALSLSDLINHIAFGRTLRVAEY